MTRSDPLRRALGSPYSWPNTLLWLWRYVHPSVSRPSDLVPLASSMPDAGGPATRAVTLAFLGDVMPTEPGLTVSVDAGFAALIGDADVVALNCEASLGRELRVRGTRLQGGVAEFKRRLSELGVHPDRVLVSLANNHAEDGGPESLLAAACELENLGCHVVGLRRNAEDRIVRAIAAGDLRAGIAAWTNWRNRPARDSELRPWTSGDARATDWAEVRRGLGIDLLIGFPHWDLEFRHFPSPATRACAKQLAARGFDLVVGHHPHVIQGVERFGDTAVLYSCGNAVSNAFCARRWPCRLGLLFEVRIRCEGERALLAGYRAEPFLFERRGSHATLKILSASGDVPERVKKRLSLLFPDPV